MFCFDNTFDDGGVAPDLTGARGNATSLLSKILKNSLV